MTLRAVQDSCPVNGICGLIILVARRTVPGKFRIEFVVIERSRFPPPCIMALPATVLYILMKGVFRLLTPVAGDAVIPERCSKRRMLKGFNCFCCIRPFVIGVAVDAGVCGKSPVKESLSGIFLKKSSRNTFHTDLILFVTADALKRSRAAERLVTAQAVSFKCIMSFHKRTGTEQRIGKGDCQSGKNDGG